MPNEDEIIYLLKGCALFRSCPDDVLRPIARSMQREEFPRGQTIVHQGDTVDRMYVVASGRVNRLRDTGDGQIHQLDTATCGTAINSLHLAAQEPCYATAEAVTDVVTYNLTHDEFKKHLAGNPQLAIYIVAALSGQVRRQAKALITPLLEQKPKQATTHAYVAVSIAATVESFYRSALNAILNQALTGQKASLFPNMHIQIPTRVLYINGFKGIRLLLDQNVKPQQYSNPDLVRLGAAITPGLCMSPVSSMLEACNAGHANPEPLQKRWMRGFAPRCLREVIFGIGLNQLSDFWEERYHNVIENPTLRNAAGSMTAGIMSGYLSHVPHNMSTLKLMNPHKSYRQIFTEYAQQSSTRLPEGVNLSPKTKFGIACALSILAPKGYLIRTTQIVGSFVILNGTINTLKGISTH